MFFRSDAISVLNRRTNVVASPIPMPLATLVVTARVGHMPRTWTKTGLSRTMPFMNSVVMDLFAVVESAITAPAFG